MLTQQDIADKSRFAKEKERQELVDARAGLVEGLLLELHGLEQKQQACDLITDCFQKAQQPGFAEELKKLKLQVALRDQLFEAFSAVEVELSEQEEVLDSVPHMWATANPSKQALDEKAQAVSSQFLGFYADLARFASKESAAEEISAMQTKYMRLKKAIEERQRLGEELQARRKKVDFYKECELLRLELKGLQEQRSVLQERVGLLQQAGK